MTAKVGLEIECEDIKWSERVSCSVVSNSATPWTLAHQAPLSMGFSWWEYWNGLPFPPPGDLPKPGIEAMSPLSPALTGGILSTGWKPSASFTLVQVTIIHMIVNRCFLHNLTFIHILKHILPKFQKGAKEWLGDSLSWCSCHKSFLCWLPIPKKKAVFFSVWTALQSL